MLVLQAVAPAVSEAGAGVQVETVLTSRAELKATVPMADCSAHAQSATDAATLDSRACSVPASTQTVNKTTPSSSIALVAPNPLVSFKYTHLMLSSSQGLGAS